MIPCINEVRIKKLEEKSQTNDDSIKDLSKELSQLTNKLNLLIKVLLVIAGKVGIGLLIFMWYMIRTFIIERGM